MLPNIKPERYGIKPPKSLLEFALYNCGPKSSLPFPYFHHHAFPPLKTRSTLSLLSALPNQGVFSMLTAPSLPDTVEPFSLKPQSPRSLARTLGRGRRYKVSCELPRAELTSGLRRSCLPLSPQPPSHILLGDGCV